MRYHKDKKLLFVMPPRTGSTMFNTLLAQCGLPIASKGKHDKPSDAPAGRFDGYTVYGFFRDPLERFLSLLRYTQQKRADFFAPYFQMPAEQIAQLSYDEMLDLMPLYEKAIPFYFDAQVHWFENGELLDYRNYVPECLRVARMLDATQVCIGLMNETDNSGIQPSQKVIDFVQTYYADDYRLGRERGLLA